jgi:transcription initiation factor TFIID TATA-box-binding protein
VIKAVIVNVVATAALNQTVDFFELGGFREILHDPEIYGGRVAYFKSRDMEGKVSIFPSGKLISVGTKSEKKAAIELELAKDFLVKNHIIGPTNLKTRTQNIVLCADIGESINLEELTKNQQAPKVIYEPEQFPGGIVRIKEPYKATLLMFASGKIVIAGLKGSYQIERILQKIIDILDEDSR